MCDYDGYSYERISHRVVVTRAKHECGSCLRDFAAGTRMDVYVGKTEGEIARDYGCPTCVWAFRQPDETDLHLCWGWRWGEYEYDDSDDRWSYVSETLAAKAEPTIVGYQAWRLIPGKVPLVEADE